MSQVPEDAEDNDSTGRISEHEFSMALETLMNSIYLIETEAGHSEHVMRYALLAESPLGVVSCQIGCIVERKDDQVEVTFMI